VACAIFLLLLYFLTGICPLVSCATWKAAIFPPLLSTGCGVVSFLVDVMVSVSFELCSDQAFAVVMVLLFRRHCKGNVANR